MCCQATCQALVQIMECVARLWSWKPFLSVGLFEGRWIFLQTQCFAKLFCNSKFYQELVHFPANLICCCFALQAFATSQEKANCSVSRKAGQIPDSEIALTWRNVSPIVTILGDGKLKLLHIFLILFCNCGASQDRFIAMVLSMHWRQIWFGLKSQVNGSQILHLTT